MQQLTQDNARLQREVEALGDVRRQERTLQGNVQQLTQDNARLQREVEAWGEENARLTQFVDSAMDQIDLIEQLQQQERQRIAPPNGDGGQWNLSLQTVVMSSAFFLFGRRNGWI